MTSKETKRRESGDNPNQSQEGYILVLHNDNVHSFDYVIDALIVICCHEYEQALQCTFITHYKGWCEIRKGDMETLKKMQDALSEKGLNTTINLKS